MNRKKILVVKQEEVERQIQVRHMIRPNPRRKNVANSFTPDPFTLRLSSVLVSVPRLYTSADRKETN